MVRPKRLSAKRPAKYPKQPSVTPGKSTRTARLESVEVEATKLQRGAKDSDLIKEGERSSPISAPQSEEISSIERSTSSEESSGVSLAASNRTLFRDSERSSNDSAEGTPQSASRQATHVGESGDPNWQYDERSGARPSPVLRGDSHKMPEMFSQDEDGDTYLHIAVAQGNEPLVNFLTRAMKHVTLDIYNKLRQTPLHLAVITKQAGLVKQLIESGADVNLMDRHGQTTLHLACQLDDVECVKAIRDATSGNRNRLKLDMSNFQGFSALHVATIIGDRELIGLVLDMGADINVQDASSGRTALHHAVESGRYHVAEFLLSRDASPNEFTFAGNTPLHTAAGREMDNIVTLLTGFGASVNIANREGDTPKVVRGSELGKRQLESSRRAPKRQKTSSTATSTSTTPKKTKVTVRDQT